MSSSAEQQEAMCPGPIAAADTTNGTGTMRVLLTGANQTAALGTLPAGRWARVCCNSLDDIQWAYGIGSAPSLTYNQTSAFGAGSAGSGETLLSKTSDQHIVPKGATHIAFRSSATNGGYFEWSIRESRE